MTKEPVNRQKTAQVGTLMQPRGSGVRYSRLVIHTVSTQWWPV